MIIVFTINKLKRFLVCLLNLLDNTNSHDTLPELKIKLKSNRPLRIAIILAIKRKCSLNNKILSIIKLIGSCNLNCQKSGASQSKIKEILTIIVFFNKSNIYQQFAKNNAYNNKRKEFTKHLTTRADYSYKTHLY